MQQLYPLRPYFCGQRRYAREVAARPIEARDISRRDWVVAGVEDDRKGCGRSLCCQDGRRAVRGNHGHLAPDQVGCQRRKLIIWAVCQAIFDRHAAAVDIAGLAQPLAARMPTVRVQVKGFAMEEAYHRLRRLLRMHTEWPCGRRAAEQRDEVAPSNFEHGLPSGTRCASLPHAQVAAEAPAGLRRT